MALELVDRWLLAEGESQVWELFHENSKMSRHERHPTFPLWPSDARIVRAMRGLREVKPYTDCMKVALPRPDSPRDGSIEDVIRRRETARAFSGHAVSLAQLSNVLALGYGVSRSSAETGFPRSFRMVPSGGALYPLELYVYATRVDGLGRGLYHFDPHDLTLDLVRDEDLLTEVLDLVVQRDLASSAAAVIFISAVFYRSTFKYGDRGYRFTLLEAGHLAQNANLVAQAMGLATANLGGYADRDADRLLGCDGLSESTIYMLLLGRPSRSAGDDAASPAASVLRERGGGE